MVNKIGVHVAMENQGAATKPVEIQSLGTVEAREAFADLVNEAAFGGRRTVVTRRGKALAAIVPVPDLVRVDPDQIPGWSVVTQSNEVFNFTVPSGTQQEAKQSDVTEQTENS